MLCGFSLSHGQALHTCLSLGNTGPYRSVSMAAKVRSAENDVLLQQNRQRWTSLT